MESMVHTHARTHTYIYIAGPKFSSFEFPFGTPSHFATSFEKYPDKISTQYSDYFPRKSAQIGIDVETQQWVVHACTAK